ncbi:hypothetical protein [Hydrocarboniphaga effusa]
MIEFVRELPRVIASPVLSRLPGGRISAIAPIEPVTLTNPSIVVQGGEIVAAVREVKYRLSRFVGMVQSAEPLRVSTWLYRYRDIASSPSSVLPLQLDPASELADLILEDPRIFVWNGGLWCLWTSVSLDDDRCYLNKMVLGRLDGNVISCLRIIESPHERRREKNWIPFVRNGQLHFIYELASLEIYRLNDKGLEIVSREDGRISALEGCSGSSQLIPWGEDWICVAHRALLRPRGWYLFPLAYYRHRFIVLSPDFRLKAMSAFFFFEKRNIEFCAGMVSEGEHVLLSFGVGDRTARVLRLHKEQVMSLLDRQ